jgi:tetratricopeptide (TPR) repeat protein
MSRPLLSTALIVRDEERYLADCLRSLRGLADEVVVVDTGSRDRTPEIARESSARLYDVPWCNDFAAARNAALDRCHGEWILYIDADERARPCDRATLERQLRKWWHVGHYVMLYPKRGYTPYREMRLFRNAPDIRFEGVIHENIWPALHRHGGRIGYSNLALDHEGYETEQERKHARNLPLLLRALEVDPKRVYCWYHLGRIYRELGRIAQAREALQRAVELARAKVWAEGEDSLAYCELIMLGLEHGDPALAGLVAEARRRFPRQPYLIWLECRLRLRERDIGKAARLCRRLLEGDAGGWRPHGLGYDARLFNAWPEAGLATCLFQEGRYAESRGWFAQAERSDPDELEYRIKRQLCERLAAGAVTAAS